MHCMRGEGGWAVGRGGRGLARGGGVGAEWGVRVELLEVQLAADYDTLYCRQVQCTAGREACLGDSYPIPVNVPIESYYCLT